MIDAGVSLADGLNMGLTKMARACESFSLWELTRAATWHVRLETYERALAMVVASQAKLPMARFWGNGVTASSDGQFFPAASGGKIHGVRNARYGSEPGTKLYAHVADTYAPFHVQQIEATAFEAPYVLDGLVGIEAGLQISEQFVDTGGVTDHIFAACVAIAVRFAPRIRNLPDRRLYLPGAEPAPDILAPLIGGKIRTA